MLTLFNKLSEQFITSLPDPSLNRFGKQLLRLNLDDQKFYLCMRDADIAQLNALFFKFLSFLRVTQGKWLLM